MSKKSFNLVVHGTLRQLVCFQRLESHEQRGANLISLLVLAAAFSLEQRVGTPDLLQTVAQRMSFQRLITRSGCVDLARILAAKCSLAQIISILIEYLQLVSKDKDMRKRYLLIISIVEDILIVFYYSLINIDEELIRWKLLESPQEYQAISDLLSVCSDCLSFNAEESGLLTLTSCSSQVMVTLTHISQLALKIFMPLISFIPGVIPSFTSILR